MDKVYTGVFNTRNIIYIWDDIDNGIDLEYEAHLNECINDDHSDCSVQDNIYEHMVLIGYIKDLNGSYEVDTSAEYSGIYKGDGVIQITNSKWGIYGRLCSPCYPNQINGDEVGNLLGYAPPPELIEEDTDDTDLLKRIFKLKGGE